MKSALLLALTAAAAVVLSAKAAESADHASEEALALHGRIESEVYVPIQDRIGSQLQQSSTSLWIDGKSKFSDRSFGRFELRGQHIDSSVQRSPGFRIELREAYLDYAANDSEFKLGRLILPWGKSDVVQPTDFLGAKNYTLFSVDEESRRVGANSLWAARSAGSWTLTFVWTPQFPQSELLIPPNTAPSFSTTTVNVDSQSTLPAMTLGRSETALRASYLGTGWDSALTFFRGWNHLPYFELAPGSTAAAVSIRKTFRRISAIGWDGSLNAGAWILRWESAYTWTDNARASHALVEPSHLDTVLGAERPWGDHLRLQGQLLWRYHPHFLSPSSTPGTDPLTQIANPAIASANAQLQGYQFRSRTGASLRVSYAHEDSGLEAEVFGLGNFIGGDYLVRPKLTYAWTEALKTSLGMDYYGGPTNRTLGALQAYNAIFLQGKYLF